jgi:hypothetical protein
MTYTLIDSVTLTTSAASVTFSSISAAGKGDLVLVCDVIGTGFAQASFRVNADSSSNYNNVEMSGDGSSTASGAGSSQTSGYVDYNSSSLSNSVRSTLTLQALDFSATDKDKSFLYRGGRADGRVNASALRWTSTSAITSLTFYANQFAATSTFHLYQIVSE